VNIPVTIVILTYNRMTLLKNLLASIGEIQYRPLEVIVVDNCSEDLTREMVQAQFPTLGYIRTQRNIGADARNLGLRSASGEVVITLDDDVLGLTDQAILQVCKIFQEKASVGAVNFRIVNPSTGELCNWVHHCLPEQYARKMITTYEITEGAVAFRSHALADAGYYPEGFFLSHEGPDLAYRMMDAGYDILYWGAITVEHFHSDLGRKPWLNYYYDTRNQFWLAARHFPFSYAALYLIRGLVPMLAYAIRDGYFPYFAKGFKDGILGLNPALGQRKVLKPSVMAKIRQIDKRRPSTLYSFKTRFLTKGARL